MNPKKRQNVPVDEVMTRLKRGHTIEQITRDLRQRTGELFSTSLLRRVATDAGWRFSTTAPQRSRTNRRTAPATGSTLPADELPHIAAALDAGRPLAELASAYGVPLSTLAQRLANAGHPTGIESPPAHVRTDHIGQLTLTGALPHTTYRIHPQPDGTLLLVPQAPHR